MVEMIKDDVPILNTNPDIPGLAPRPSAPVPEAPTASDLPNIPLCANCAPLHRTVTLCFERISAAESRINAAILLGKEAIERSSARVGAYDVLQRVLVSHGIRECHGFVNPCGLMPQVPAGAGAGCEFVTLAQPVPVTRV